MNTNKLREFVNDSAMSNAVYEVLMRFFLKKRDTKDVQMLAAERMSAFLLEDAWKEIERFKVVNKEIKTQSNVGL